MRRRRAPLPPYKVSIDHITANSTTEIEMTTYPAKIDIYVRNETSGKEILRPEDASVHAVILADGKIETISLAPAGGALRGAATSVISENEKIALVLQQIFGCDGIPSTTFDLSKNSSLFRGRPQRQNGPNLIFV